MANASGCRERTFLVVLSLLCSLIDRSSAFLAFVPQGSIPQSALHYKHKDNDDDSNLLGGDGPNEHVPSGLQERLRDLQRQEARIAAVAQRNWIRANWKVNGIPWNATIGSVLATTTTQDDDDAALLVGDATGTVSFVQCLTNGVPSSSVLEEDAPVEYEILHQWNLPPGTSVQLLAADEDFVYASDKSGVIHQWEWDDEEDATSQATTIVTSPSHTLQAISGNRLVSVSAHGVSIWKDGSLLGECKTEEEIICAAADDDKVYFGMVNGDIVVHSLQRILDSATAAELPLARWSGTRDDAIGISALAIGGETRMGSQMVQVLYTGDTAGGVKQWFLLPQGGGGTLQPWPKLSTQRLPKKAHVFPGHSGRVQSILAVDGVKFVSSSVDATVKGWNTATGKEIFSMEGFPTMVDSLATLDGFLVTNGMGQYLPLNDFTVDDDDFDLDMPEYI